MIHVVETNTTLTPAQDLRNPPCLADISSKVALCRPEFLEQEPGDEGSSCS